MRGARRFGSLATAAVSLTVVLAASFPARADMVRAGQKAPRLTLRDFEGRVFNLADQAYPGTARPSRPKQPVVLDFFRTDCPPCKAKLPGLLDLHNKHAAAGLSVVLVALLEPGEGEQKLQAFLAKNPVPFLVIVDRYEDTARRWIHDGQSLALPTIVLVDRDGMVKAVDQSFEPPFLQAVEAALSPAAPVPTAAR